MSSEEIGTSESAASVEGPWSLPADVRAAGADASVGYDDVGRWTGASGCAGGLTEGARRLGAVLQERFGAISSIGGYSCRQNTANSSKMSVHGGGRALDVFIPKSGGAADNGRGDPVANWLVMNAQRIGVQLIIWDRAIWRPGRNESRYTGPHPHDDHLHVEITVAASRMQTPFFSSEETEDPGMATPTDEGGGAMNEMDEGEEMEEEELTEPMPEPMDPEPPPVKPPPKPVEPEPEPDPVTKPTPTEEEPPEDADRPRSVQPDEYEPEGDDSPGERTSIGRRSKKKSSKNDAENEMPDFTPSAGACAVTGPGTAGSDLSPLAGLAGLAFVVRVTRRRKRA